MGSELVIKSASGAERYLTRGRKAVPEGIEALVPYKGSLAEIVSALSSEVQVGMGYVGAKNLSEFRTQARFVRVTQASIAESRPHSLHETVTEEMVDGR